MPSNIENKTVLELLPPHTLNQFQKWIDEGSWDAVINYVRQKNNNDENGIAINYDIIFHYAIKQNALLFIENTTHHPEVMQELNYYELTDWLKGQNIGIQQKIIVGAINANAGSHPFPQIINRGIKNFFKMLMAGGSEPKISPLVEIILKSPDLEDKKRLTFLCNWVSEFSDCYSQSSNKDNMLKAFIAYLQVNESNVHILLMKILTSKIDESDKMKVFKTYLQKFSVSPPQIAAALAEPFDGGAILGYQKLLQLLIEFEPENAAYKLMLNFLQTPPAEQFNFILENPQILDENLLKIPSSFCCYAVERLTYDERKTLFIKCINHEFPYPTLIVRWMFYLDNISDEALIINYLQAPHLVLLPMLLTYVIKNEFTGLTSMIHLIINRSDYKLDRNDLMSPLLHLFEKNEAECIDKLLAHPKVFALLKDYYRLSCDDCLKSTDRGRLLPTVVAWYMSNNIELCRELFFNFSEKQQKELRENSYIPLFIDTHQPSLTAYALQHGYIEFLAIDDFKNRFLNFKSNGTPEISAPKAWQNPKVINTLKRHQRRLAINFTGKHIDALPLKVSSETARQLAPKIAIHFSNFPLTLQHQTENANIILKDGVFKIPQHILKHPIYGKATKGLQSPAKQKNATKDYAFNFFSRLPNLEDKETRVTNFDHTSCSRFVFNLHELLRLNPHIVTLVIGPYNYFDDKKILKLSDGLTITSDPYAYEESTNLRKINLDSPNGSLYCIYTALFELVIDQFIVELPASTQKRIIEQLCNPKTKQDHQLAVDLLDLLYLEWLVPSDIPLDFAYVDLIEHEGKSFPFADLRKLMRKGSEANVLNALDDFAGMLHLPFVQEPILLIARARGFKQVIEKLTVTPLAKKNQDIVYYPHEVYQIEALAQLILEDFSARVYVHYTENSIKIHSSLVANSNRNGAHHAEMPKLYKALGLADFDGQSALEIRLKGVIEVPFGSNERFKSLEDIRDALLTYELTTVLVSEQNWRNYLETKGQFHEITGKGANNGKVGLLNQRLFLHKKPYTINAAYSDHVALQIHSSDADTLDVIAEGIGNVLNIRDNIQLDNNQLKILIKPTELIAKLRQTAICYEGLNVITDEGKILLAYRSDKGLASAGGHHGNKYSRLDITYGLYSEFGLQFINFEELLNCITLIAVEKPSKTGIYIIKAGVLKSSLAHASSPLDFRADPEEFDAGSEIALTLIEMRGKRFYDVMPLDKLGGYYLQQLKNYISDTFPEIKDDISATIDTSYDIEIGTGRFKVPTQQFGQMTLQIAKNIQITEPLEIALKDYQIANECGKRIFKIDQDAFSFINLIESMLNCTKLQLT